MRAAPFLQFDGNCAEAFAFYGECFGNAPAVTMTYGQSPMAEQVSVHHRKRVMYTEVAVGDSIVMGSDVMAGFTPAAGFHVSVRVESAEAAERVFAALSSGGVITMPMQATFWAPRFGVLKDRFGVPWMVNYQV